MQRFRSIFVSVSSALLLAGVWAAPALADSAAEVAKIQTFIQSVIAVLVTGAGALATVFLVVGGIRYITSTGNPHNLEKAKHTIVYSILGLAISLGAYVLSSMVSGLAVAAFGK